MSYSTVEAAEIAKYFQGNNQAYGVTIPGEMVDGKVTAKSFKVTGVPMPTVWADHLNGKRGIGIAPLKDDGTCSFAAIDIDDYEYDLMDIVRAIHDFEIPLVPCWSKSHKLHLYAFFSDEPPATDVVEYLKWYTLAFACKPKTEIFPKQSKTTEDNKFYSWINMPYFDANNGESYRKAIARDGHLMSLSEAVAFIQGRQIALGAHQQWIKSFRYGSAPPCVLSGILLRDIGPGQRNNWLFSVGVFLQLQDDTTDLGAALTEVNRSLKSPIDDDELRTTIIKGFQRKTYYYMCAQMSRCNKAFCKAQEFGVDSKFSTGLDYGELTQYVTDPPYYEWIVNGQKLSFWSEQEILGQGKFRALCLRQLHLVPRTVPDEKWTKILNKACEHINIVEPSGNEGDFTTGSTFMDLVTNFFHDKRRAENITQIGMGRVFEDDATKEYCFMAKPFMDYLITKNNFRTYTPVEIRSRLQDLGAHKDGLTWRIPIDNVPASQKIKPEIDFSVKENPDDPF